MASDNLTAWLDEFSEPKYVWCVKRLSANDTLANGSHQAGPYIPKDFLFSLFPSINRTDIKNPDHKFELQIDSHPDIREIRVIYYNNRFAENKRNGRNETRLTNFGGKSSPLLDPENTGAIAVFGFSTNTSGHATGCHVWVCRNAVEEDLVEDRIGPIEPGICTIWSAEHALRQSLTEPSTSREKSCWLTPDKIPVEWMGKFPTGAEIIRKTVELRSDATLVPDARLLRRRECEFEIFRSVEEATELPVIQAGFTSVNEFIAKAQSILQRRKARSGHSLELHAKVIFVEEHLKEGKDFSHGPESDPGRRPDFLFPSETAYKDTSFPSSALRMLAVKTTCRDRWRQILNEATRIERKHLLTLQEGISEGQFQEMTDANVQLVVPGPLIEKFPQKVRPHLMTLESFIKEVRTLGGTK